MKKSILTFAFLMVLFSLTIFNAQSQSVEKIKSKIEKINAEMSKAMVEGDHEKGLSLYLDNAISLPNYSPMLVGIEAIRMSNEAMASSGVKVKSFDISTEKVMMGGDLIVEIGKYKMSMQMPGSDETITDVGKYMNIWEKQKDGSLKIKADTWNTDNNSWMGMAEM